jgi:hypothetical protein
MGFIQNRTFKRSLKLKKTFIGIMGFLVVLAASGNASAGDTGLGIKAGTLGVGIDITKSLLPQLNTRVGFNALLFDYNGDSNDIDYDVDVELGTINLFLDYYPIKTSKFRLTGGILYNRNDISATGKAKNGTFNINDVIYSASDISSLGADIDLNQFAPYLGLGYGNTLSKDGKWFFNFDLGAMYHGSPDASLTVTSDTLSEADMKTLQGHVDAEERELNDDISSLAWYPVIQFSVTYKF